MREDAEMPNKTIYVADPDLPLFERAQEMAGGNLSAAIAQALRQFVDAHETRTAGEITLKVGRNGAYTFKRFQGRHIAKQTVTTHNSSRSITYNVYLTTKGNYAVYVRDFPSWAQWSGRRWRGRRGENDEEQWGWAGDDWWNEHVARLEVYDSLEALKDNVPPDLYEVAAHANDGDGTGIEDLDI
jgi:EXLDI family protein